MGINEQARANAALIATLRQIQIEIEESPNSDAGRLEVIASLVAAALKEAV